ncbi:MAG: hypothetical protein N3F07_01310 [Candidatus Micrarchaeota archaeon]|nr:hypothetical protein [Candidatus Micrarchaeota archaeon]
MGSDKTKALISFAKIAVAIGAGYAMVTIWSEARAGMDPEYEILGNSVPLIPYAAGLVVAVMVFFLLSKMSKSGGD